MFMSRNNCVICVLALALALALAGPGWAQGSKPASPEQVSLYHRAAAFLELAEQALHAGNVVEAKSLVRQSNSLIYASAKGIHLLAGGAPAFPTGRPATGY